MTRPAARGARIALLRAFQLTSDGRRIELPLAAQRVLAFLALRDRRLQRVHVAGNLWIESSEEHAGANLRTALWRIKQTGLPLLNVSSTQLELRGDVEVDVQTVAEAARGVLADGVAAAASGFLDIASIGELLPDWYDDWVIVERERLRQLQVHALESLCVTLAGEGRFAQAVAAGTAAVACEPLRESAHRVLIETFLAEGNVSDALRQYRLVRELLRTQLGLEPSPTLQDLVAPLPAA